MSRKVKVEAKLSELKWRLTRLKMSRLMKVKGANAKNYLNRSLNIQSEIALLEKELVGLT
jgi:hypothetical protein